MVKAKSASQRGSCVRRKVCTVVVEISFPTTVDSAWHETQMDNVFANNHHSSKAVPTDNEVDEIQNKQFLNNWYNQSGQRRDKSGTEWINF